MDKRMLAYLVAALGAICLVFSGLTAVGGAGAIAHVLLDAYLVSTAVAIPLRLHQGREYWNTGNLPQLLFLVATLPATIVIGLLEQMAKEVREIRLLWRKLRLSLHKHGDTPVFSQDLEQRLREMRELRAATEHNLSTMRTDLSIYSEKQDAESRQKTVELKASIANAEAMLPLIDQIIGQLAEAIEANARFLNRPADLTSAEVQESVKLQQQLSALAEKAEADVRIARSVRETLTTPP